MDAVRIAVTGAGGQIAYSLLFSLCRGGLLGPSTPIELRCLDLPDSIKILEGVKMELEDGAYPLLKSVEIGSDPEKIFEGIDLAFLVGAKPRGPGMERKDLLEANAKIFVSQGKALDKSAKKDAKILVVGNPCNTNCLIAMKSAPSLSPRNFFAMTMLDELRAKNMLAKKAEVPVSEVTNVAIWGNHSSSQVPDFTQAKIERKPAIEVIGDRAWFEGPFIKNVSERGAAIIAARGKSSAASAANAAMQQMKALLVPTPKEQFFSAGVYSENNPYGIDPDLVFSFPIKADQKTWQIVEGIEHEAFIKQKIRETEKELQEERDMAFSLLGSGV